MIQWISTFFKVFFGAPLGEGEEAANQRQLQNQKPLNLPINFLALSMKSKKPSTKPKLLVLTTYGSQITTDQEKHQTRHSEAKLSVSSPIHRPWFVHGDGA